ncbi:urease accessory protein UreE [Pelagibacterium luteolum]|uniref:Urease accessory protein UreE n=1 Tax=Pelagibacterium luteolum TaxID=440168 RepID=A0A1G7SQI6_9HYPH|nr:urease accessory protein UreE [Pelagibacterium luteolum]SDG25064.1 urease accessory protein [Pelagibacterium luteolum]
MRATGIEHKGHWQGAIAGRAVLPHDQRAVRRKLITLDNGLDVLVDLPETTALDTGDALKLEDGRFAEIVAAKEPLYAITGRSVGHLAELVWHIGNRHLPCQIETKSGTPQRLFIGRDHVIKEMLEGLGAAVTEVSAPFSPLRGAYAGHAHGHAHHHG